MSRDIGELAEEFATQLNDLFAAVFGVESAFAIVATQDDVGRRIGIGPFDPNNRGFRLFPLRRKIDSVNRLFLDVQYDVALDDDASHLMVRSSIFGFWVHPWNNRKTPRPLFRIEYDREATGGKPPAHVHIHADSAELGWLIGSSGEPLRRHSEIHFPVGGRRFRPTIEDLLLFLDHEKLFTDWPMAEWRTAVAESRERFEEAQARATVRRHPAVAAEQLRKLGFDVTPQSG